MIGTCRALSVFPPADTPEEVLDDDFSYEDVSAPLPVIAQRLFNDQRRRLEEGDSSEGVGDRLQRRAMTAAFIVDFAHEVGVALPQMPEIYQSMLRDFAARATEWGQANQEGVTAVAGGSAWSGRWMWPVGWSETQQSQLKRPSGLEGNRELSSWGSATRMFSWSAATLMAQGGCLTRAKNYN